MKKVIIKIITIFIAFLLGILSMSYLYNKGNLDMTAHMAEATLPILYFEQDGKLINTTYGYVSEVDASCLRNSIVPLDEERIVSAALEKYNAEIEKVSYEVRSTDMERLIQNGEVKELKEAGQYVKFSVKIKDLLENTEEYILIFHVELKDREDVKYYTRISNSSQELIEACTQFAMDFHNATLDPENIYPITQYLETDSSRKETSLAKADIHSKYKTIIWNGMRVEQEEEPEMTFLELEEDVVSLNLNYQVTYENEQGEKENYQVQDYFRIRQTSLRMYLLDYERTAERIFSPEDAIFETDGLKLGIQGEDVQYLSNEEGSVVNFVVSNELWCYDIAQNKLSKVFSFKNGSDKRGLHQEFSIQLINMEDSGSMDFMVIGYMNRGRHEGETGAAVMRYDSLTNTTEELLFLESGKCADVLEETIGKLLYVSYDEKLYLSWADHIYVIDLNTKMVETLTEELAAGKYVISRGGDKIAWQHGKDRFGASKITVMDMKTGVRRTYEAKDGEFIFPLGFSSEDFLYGICASEDVSEDFAGNTLFPMYRVSIVDQNGQSVRDFDYYEKNKYVISASIENNRINLECISQNEDGSYSPALTETITSSEEELVSAVKLIETEHTVKKLEYAFRFQTEAKGKMKKITPKQILFEDDRSILLEEEESVYYAYGRGKITGVYGELREAVATAYETMGVVTDPRGQVVWARGKRKTRSVLELANGTEAMSASNSLEAGIRILLEQEGVYAEIGNLLEDGESPYQILRKNSKKQAENFTGCNLSSVLYYVSEGNAVLAMTDAGSAELIVGYDAQNIFVLDPITGTVHKEGQKDAAQKYEACGNVFFSFLK